MILNSILKRMSSPLYAGLLGFLLAPIIQAASLWKQEPQLAAGLRHSIYVDARGKVYAFGDNSLGQLGVEGTYGGNDPQFPMEPKKGRVIGSGWNHVLAATRPTWTRRPELWVWGYGDTGQLGIGLLLPFGFFPNYQYREPFPVLPTAAGEVRDVVQLAGGMRHSMALVSSGILWTWGGNDSGQLGLGDHNVRWTPAQVKGLMVKSMAAGASFSLALAQDNTVWAWGANECGQLGLGDLQARSLPARIPESRLVQIVALSAGDAFSLALDANGSVYAWGSGNEGQFGGCSPENPRPMIVPGLPSIIAIAAGHRHALVLAKDGTVWAWGANERGQLGNNDSATYRAKPAQVTGMTGVLAIAAGGMHSLALKENQELYAWGDNSFGELGIGETPAGFVALPVRVPFAGK